jgi:hypothetical protein
MSQASETTRQMFKRADNDEGYIAVIAHRARDIPALQEQGWRFTADEALADSPESTSVAAAAPAPSTMSRDELEAQATELGIDFDGRTSDKKLKERIDEALAG